MATFTKDSADAVDSAAGRPISSVFAIERTHSLSSANGRIAHVIDNSEYGSYRDAARIVNEGPWDVVCSLPRRESDYTTDDNARALRLAARLWNMEPSAANLSSVACYLRFMEHARTPSRGFHNFMGYQRDWLDSGGIEDCQGQAILALAEVLVCDLPSGFNNLAAELLDDSLPPARELRSLRAIAFLDQAWFLLKMAHVRQFDKRELIAIRAAEQLLERYERAKRDDWFWFESRMTYANAVLPHALFDAAELGDDAPFRDAAEATFGCLELSTLCDGLFLPIGNRDWYSHGEDKSIFDQQPMSGLFEVVHCVSRGRVTPMADSTNRLTASPTVLVSGYNW